MKGTGVNAGPRNCRSRRLPDLPAGLSMGTSWCRLASPKNCRAAAALRSSNQAPEPAGHIPGCRRWRLADGRASRPEVRALYLGSRVPVEFEDRTHREGILRMQSVPWYQHKHLPAVVKGPSPIRDTWWIRLADPW